MFKCRRAKIFANKIFTPHCILCFQICWNMLWSIHANFFYLVIKKKSWDCRSYIWKKFWGAGPFASKLHIFPNCSKGSEQAWIGFETTKVFEGWSISAWLTIAFCCASPSTCFFNFSFNWLFSRATLCTSSWHSSSCSWVLEYPINCRWKVAFSYS